MVHRLRMDVTLFREEKIERPMSQPRVGWVRFSARHVYHVWAARGESGVVGGGCVCVYGGGGGKNLPPQQRINAF